MKSVKLIEFPVFEEDGGVLSVFEQNSNAIPFQIKRIFNVKSEKGEVLEEQHSTKTRIPRKILLRLDHKRVCQSDPGSRAPQPRARKPPPLPDAAAATLCRSTIMGFTPRFVR